MSRKVTGKALASLRLVILAGAFVAQPAAAQTMLFEGARLIAGDGSPTVENAALLVERGTITHVGRRGELAAPAGAGRIELAGKTVPPALVARTSIRASRTASPIWRRISSAGPRPKNRIA